MEYDKPFKDFDELLQSLVIKHGMTVPIPFVAKDILKYTPYYDLVNGYKDHFMVNDIFLSQVSFQQLYWFHIFDRGFQNILFQFSIVIEDYFKNILAYVLAKHFGVDTSQYLNPTHYLKQQGQGKRATRRGVVLPEIRKVYENPLQNPTLHYVKNHNHVPPWILLRNVTFSNAIKLFALLKRDAKSELLSLILPYDIPYEQQIPLLRYILTLVRRCRNVIAHNLKFIHFDATQYAKSIDQSALRQILPQCLISDDELKHKSFICQIYGYIMFSIVLIPDPVLKTLFISNILNYFQPKFPRNSTLYNDWRFLGMDYMTTIGLPTDVVDRLIHYSQSLESRYAIHTPSSLKF